MVVSGGSFLREITGMLGLFLARLGQIVLHPGQLPMTALVHHARSGRLAAAVPIVSLMSFLIGGGAGLSRRCAVAPFGGPRIFVVDLIAISILRELGIPF